MKNTEIVKIVVSLSVEKLNRSDRLVFGLVNNPTAYKGTIFI